MYMCTNSNMHDSSKVGTLPFSLMTINVVVSYWTHQSYV